MNSMKYKKHWNLSLSILNDPKTLANILQIYIQSNNLNAGKHLHAQLIRSLSHVWKYVNNYLINLYAKCGHFEYAQKVFDKMPYRNFVSWTALISAFSQHALHDKALIAFSQMRFSGECPNEFALSSVLQTVALLKYVGFGRQVHCLCLKCGFCNELFVGSNLANMYSKCGVIYDCCKVFEEMPYKDEVSWTSMIDGFAKNGEFEKGLVGFKMMLFEGKVIDKYVVSCSLSACGAIKAGALGRSVHSMVVKLGLEKEISVGNALVDMYSKTDDIDSAAEVFGNQCSQMNIVSYTSLIDGYVEAGRVEKAVEMFVELKREGMRPNEYTFSSLLKACAYEGALEQGSQLHAQVLKMKLAPDPYVSSTLILMYGRCGLLDHSERLFNYIKNPSEFVWNSLLGGFSQHGLGKEAIRVFERMVRKGIKPNGITFMTLLTGCSHSGLVEEGLHYFNSMERGYGVIPTTEHYSCVIDLLSRAGKLKEADDFISQMPFEPNAFGWTSYLRACKIQGDKARAEFAAEKLIKLEPDNTSLPILLASIYGKEKQREDVKKLKKVTRESNIKKMPGFSWINIGYKTHVFESHDWSHPQHQEIYKKLDNLMNEIKKIGYIPQCHVINIDIANIAKEKMLRYHSEKLAVAFALMSLPPWKPIIIKKNLRICLDCHSAFKLIAKVSGRTIIVRDSVRFHNFSDGLCSCGDFW